MGSKVSDRTIKELLNTFEDDIKEAILDFFEYRVERNKNFKLVNTTKKHIIDTVKKLHSQGENVIDCINRSIERNWTGIFPIKKNYSLFSLNKEITQQENDCENMVIRQNILEVFKCRGRVTSSELDFIAEILTYFSEDNELYKTILRYLEIKIMTIKFLGMADFVEKLRESLRNCVITYCEERNYSPLQVYHYIYSNLPSRVKVLIDG